MYYRHVYLCTKCARNVQKRKEQSMRLYKMPQI